ncbi:hypothetical protein, partial [Streptomyces sp. NPDC088115]|uniref:hypothetical protein n=1 Tax=Streptomyces sp. NPDC088115 TaxID=3365824 RepID=UPI0037FC360B
WLRRLLRTAFVDAFRSHLVIDRLVIVDENRRRWSGYSRRNTWRQKRDSRWPLASISSSGVRIRMKDLRTPAVHHGTAPVEDVRLHRVARHQENVPLTEHNVLLGLCAATSAMPRDLKVQ